MAFKPSHLAQKQSFTATRIFTDREAPRELFKEALNREVTDDVYQVLAFYGVGGQGKSELCREFVRMLEKQRDENKSIFSLGYAKVNFEDARSRRIDEALLMIRLKLSETAKINFPAFDFAFARYQAKAYPGIDIRTKYPELFKGESEVLEDMIDISGDLLSEIPGFSFVYKYGSRMTARFNEWWQCRGRDLLEGLDELSEDQLLNTLPKYLGADIYASLFKKEQSKPEKRLVILLDTYEALWRDTNLKSGSAAQRIDGWVRQLIQESPGVLFVLLGRNQLNWEELDADWGEVLDQHRLGGLSDSDADGFLLKVPIPEAKIRQTIISSAKGLPFYLDLQVDLYADEKNKGSSLIQDLFGGDEGEIIARFLDHLDDQVERLLRVMAQPRYFDEALFHHLCDQFFGGAATVCLRQVADHSFIDRYQNRYKMHELMREYLINKMKLEEAVLYKKTHSTLYLWCVEKALANRYAELTPIHIESLYEAAYHLEQMNFDDEYLYLEGLFAFVTKHQFSYKDAAHVIEPFILIDALIIFYKKYITLSNKQGNKINRDALYSCLLRLTILNVQYGAYEEACHILRQHCEIREEVAEKLLGMAHHTLSNGMHDESSIIGDGLNIICQAGLDK